MTARWSVRVRCHGCGKPVWYIGPEGQAVAGRKPKTTCRSCGAFIAMDPDVLAAAEAEWRRTGVTQTIRTLPIAQR